MSHLIIREIESNDCDACGRILHAAFHHIAEQHGFPPDFPSVESATGLMGFIQSHSYGVVAERGGRVLGSSFLTEGDPVAAVGPISVDPTVQESGIGRALMEAIIERGRSSSGLRLVQDAFNRTSMALYASLGFDVREPLVLLSGVPRSAGANAGSDTGIEVRRLGESDLDACAAVYQKVHGITRTEELRSGLGAFRGYLALRDGRVTAYASTLNLWFAAHAAAESSADIEALILAAAAAEDEPLNFLLPTRQAPLLPFLLAQGMRIVKPMTLMTMGPYQEPAGPYLPSVGY